MSRFFGVIRHEYNMYLRRPAVWVAYLLLYAFYAVIMFFPSPISEDSALPLNELWQFAGQTLFYGNMFMTLVAGILAADRMQRDFRLGVRELQSCTPLSLPVYIMAKYCGVLIAALTPMLVWLLLSGIVYVVWYGAPLHFVGILLVAFTGMAVPAHAFVLAFSLAVPLVIPVRVYQVLFTGYWFWGNYLNPGSFPTISDTLLVPSGKYVLEGFLGGFPSEKTPILGPVYTTQQAVMNLIVLALSIVAALFVLNCYLRWQARRI